MDPCPFLRKHCKTGGAVPGSDTVRRLYIPQVYDQLHASLWEKVSGKFSSMIFDETTDRVDRSVLNLIMIVENDMYLMGVHFLESVNNSTVAQAIVASLQETNIDFSQVQAVVSDDNAAYYKKAWRDILSALLPNATGVFCLVHIMNLVGECWSKGNQLKQDFSSFFKSAFYIHKRARESRYLASGM